MTNKNDELAFKDYPAIKHQMGDEGDYLVGSDLEPAFVFSVFGALTMKVLLAQRALPKKLSKKLNKKLKPVNIQKLTFEHHDKNIEQMVNDAANCEITVCKFHNKPIRYVNVTAIGDYSHYQKNEAIRFPVNSEDFGDFLTIVEDFTCKLRSDGSTAINYIKLKSGQEFDLKSDIGPFYMDGITLSANSLRIFKDVVIRYQFTEVPNS